MKKLKILILVVIAVAVWHFVDIKTPAKNFNTPSVQISLSSSNLSAQAAASSMTQRLRNDPGSNNNPWFIDLYGYARGLLNLSLFLFLVYIAFRNILNAGIDTYSIKKMLPKIIFAAFLGNLLLPIMVILSTILDSLQGSVSLFAHPGSWSWMTTVAGGRTLGAGIGSIVLGAITMYFNLAIGAILVLVPIVITILLIGGLLLLGLFDSLRSWIVLLAVAFGPIAIGLSILPETESLFKKWLKILFFWLIYPLIIGVVFYLVRLIPSNMMGASGDGILSSLIGGILPQLIKIGLYFMAVRAPFTWEKDVGGLIAALPGQASGAYKKGLQVVEYGKKIPRLAYDQQWNMRKGVNTKLAKVEGSDEFKQTVASKLNGNEGQVAIRQQGLALMTQRLAGNKTALREMYGVDNIADVPREAIEHSYNEYLNGNLQNSNVHEDIAAQRFFNDNIEQVEQKSRSTVSKRITDKEKEAVFDDLTKKMEKTKLFKYAKFEEKYGLAATLAGMAAGQRVSGETTAKEDEKAIKRQSVGYHYGSTRMARGKSEQERLADDYSKSEKSSDLNKYRKVITEPIIKALSETISTSADPEERRLEAMVWLQDRAHGLMVDGANIVQWDVAFDPIREQIGKNGGNFEGLMNAFSVLYPRVATLTSRESRSQRDPEIQREKATQEIFQFFDQGSVEGGYGSRESYYNNPGGAPSGPTGAPSGPSGGSPSGASGGEDDDTARAIAGGFSQLSHELKAVNESVQGVRSQIRTTTGPPLERIRKLIGTQGLKGTTSDDIEELGSQTEMGLSDIGAILARKTGDDPTMKEKRERFVEDLDASKGLSTPEMIERAQKEFYPDEPIDPRLEDQIVNVSSNQVVSMEAIKQNDNNKAIQNIAGQLVINQAASPRVINELQQSINIFNKSQEDPRSVAPEALQGATKLIASHAKLPDGNTITKPMVDDIQRAIHSMVVRDPILDNPRTRPI